MYREQQAHWEQAQRYTQQKSWKQAASAYQAIVKRDPGFVPAWLELARAEEQLDEYRAARSAVLRAAERAHDAPPLMALAIARLLRKFEAIGEMDSFVQRANLGARLPADKLVHLAAFFSSANLHRPATVWVDHAIRQQPDLYEAHNMRGLLHMFAGETDASVAAYERALTIRPDSASTYSNLTRVGRVDPERHHIDIMRRLIDRPGATATDEVHLGYGLHNELHALGRYDEAWAALERACRARRSQQPYDAAETGKLFSTLRNCFTESFVQGEALPHPVIPIFIVGMHRSGTTLLERILAGNDQVADAGETYTLPAQLRLAGNHLAPGVLDRVLAERLPAMDYRLIGEGFLRDMRWRAGVCKWITEKLNPNFMLVGVIAKAMAEARIIHMRRDPIDTCFSNLRTLFSIEAAYSYDQAELADYYAAYRDLMQHWREVLPGRMLEVDYEDLVESPATVSAQVAKVCGFEYTPEMLEVERRSGMVATASVGDVRKGILKNRGGAWRAYETKLGPLIDRLSHHGLV